MGTWHTDRSGGDHDGKAQTGGLTSKGHMKAAWKADGSQASVDVGSNVHSGEGFQDVMSQYGAVFYSSQWTGWVPGSCGGDGNLGASSFSVSNVRIQGKVVQGPEPTKCAPEPTPVPTNLSPTPSGCPGGSLAGCLHLCPSDASGYKARATECELRCSSTIVV